METTYTKLFEEPESGLGLKYYMTKSQVDIDGSLHTRFGAAVERSGGERTEVLDICADPGLASELIAKLSRGLVTPVSLRDVVYDMLFALESI